MAWQHPWVYKCPSFHPSLANISNHKEACFLLVFAFTTVLFRNYNGRNGPESGGGVRRRAKSPTSVPSSCENSSPQQVREVGGDRGRERRCKCLHPQKLIQHVVITRNFRRPHPQTIPVRQHHFAVFVLRRSGRVTYPLIYVSPAGSISVILAHAIIITNDSYRSLCSCSVSRQAFINGRGTASCILHKKARMLHTRDMVYTKFSASNDRLAVIGNEGILFSMSHLNEAFLVSSHIKGPSAVSLETLDFSSGHLENDFSIRLFYHEAQTGTQVRSASSDLFPALEYKRMALFHRLRSFACLSVCKSVSALYTIMSKEIVHESFIIASLKQDGTLYSHVRDNNRRVDARPRVIQCSPSTASVHVRSSYIDMGVQVGQSGPLHRDASYQTYPASCTR
ncbi:hypothetical protein COOONC_22189 [Cooperia oncophora]